MDIKRNRDKAALEQDRKEIGDSFKLDPRVPIQLKGKEYTLEFNNFAVKGVYKDTGYNLLSTPLDKEQMNNPDIMGALLYYGLKTNHDDMTQDSADKLCTYIHQLYILSRLHAALDLFLPESAKKELEGLSDPGEAGSPQVAEDPTKPPVDSG